LSNRNHFSVDHYFRPYQIQENTKIIFQKSFYAETNGALLNSSFPSLQNLLLSSAPISGIQQQSSIICTNLPVSSYFSISVYQGSQYQTIRQMGRARKQVFLHKSLPQPSTKTTTKEQVANILNIARAKEKRKKKPNHNLKQFFFS
jgi:hypothetical protein